MARTSRRLAAGTILAVFLAAVPSSTAAVGRCLPRSGFSPPARGLSPGAGTFPVQAPAFGLAGLQSLSAPRGNAVAGLFSAKDGGLPGIKPALISPAPAFAGALSPERRRQFGDLAASLSKATKDLPAESAKDLSSRFFEPEGETPDAIPDDGLAPDKGAGPDASLRAAGPSGPRSPAVREPLRPQTGRLASLKDRWRHARLWCRQLHWYTVTHIQQLWPAYQEGLRRLAAQGQSPSVTRSRTFFSHMRVMGETGVFYVLGYSALHDAAVLREARRAWDRFFDGPGLGPVERLAFARFLGRIAGFNSTRRAHSNMRKHVRWALLTASLMPAGQIAPFFDSLPPADMSAHTEEFQREEAPKILKAFRETVLETLAEEPDAADRVLGVVLLGSFARDAATATSDLDIELIIRGGKKGRARGFNERLIAKWEKLGLQARHPITPHEHSLHPSRGLLSLVHDDAVIVLSDDAALVEALSPKPGEPAAFTKTRHMTWHGRIGRLFEFGAVFAATCWLDAKKALGRD